MIINIKLARTQKEQIDVIRLFKESDGRMFILASADHKFIFIELIAFNKISIISEVDPYEAVEWTKADTNEMFYIEDIFFYPLNILDNEKFLTYADYNIIYKQQDKYWTLEDSNVDNVLTSINFPPPLPSSVTGASAVVKIQFKIIDPISKRNINDYLDRIRQVGYNNLTPIEKDGLDVLSSL